MKLNYTENLCGNCPIQAEGITEDGLPWYFRARDSVTLTIGNGTKTKTGDTLHPLNDTLIIVDDEQIPYDFGCYPGWADHTDCEQWIILALEYFKTKQNESEN